MPQQNYKVGQIVRVDIPSTYGRIIELSKEPVAEGRTSTATSQIVGVTIEYMSIIYGLASYDGITSSYYGLDGPFKDRFHVIDPSAELDLLKTQRAKARTDEAWQRRMFSLEEAIKFLEANLPKPR
ncbi:hypothetical protein HYY70_05890 [Candidatus Woesearchaeota archaeon]|nr:hypothetical protein [Candidatus Woesearchaeota archaeon]